MLEYEYSANYDDALLAELYDQNEDYSDDVELIQKLISDLGKLRILEVFSGTGRILIPLAMDGHEVTGIEMALAMSQRLERKLETLDKDTRERVKLISGDALKADWGKGYGLVIVGANAMYELPSANSQEKLIALARKSLSLGGYLYVDNNDYKEGKEGWENGPFGEKRIIFEGCSGDGTFARFTMQNLSFDIRTNVLTMKRTLYKRHPDGGESKIEYIGRKRPVTASEIESWLNKHGFEVKAMLGDRKGNAYGKESNRAIFWAQKGS